MTTKRRILGAALALAAALPSSAAAQRTAEAFLYEAEHDHAVRATVEMDPALAVGVGYLGAVDLDVDAFHRRVGIRADVTTVIGFSSWDFSGGVAMHLAEGAGLNVLATVDLELKVVQNEVHSGIVYGYGVALRPGWFDPVWYLALEAGLHGSFGATLFHRDAYRTLFPEVQDGTFYTDSMSFFAGGAFGVRIERHLLLGLRFAWRFPRTFESYAPYVQPYTVNLEVGARF